MKELIIEEKAKAYDEAIKRAKAWKTTCSLQEGTVNLIEDIFPELKESGDEKMRKWLINYLDNRILNSPIGEEKKACTDAITWLEKQGEQKPNNNKIEIGKKYKCIASPRYTTFMIGQVYNPNDKFLCSLMNLCSDCFKPFDVIKPQGKSALEAAKEEKVDNQNCVKLADKVEPRFRVGDSIKTANEESLTITEISDRGYWSEDLFICGFDDAAKWELVEQKPDDKIEPKFKVRDWVVRGKTIAQILDIQEQYYIGLDIDGNDFTSSRFLSDDKIHLWTIQDAKDGDVLAASDKTLFIYNGNINENGNVGFYLAFIEDTKNIIIYSDDGCGWEEKDSCHPATKEQRDTLFAEIKDAGYEWDAENKQLRKIENETEISFGAKEQTLGELLEELNKL